MTQRAQRVSRTLTNAMPLQYLLYLPDGYDDDPQRRWPLILFLHGRGERGTDVERVKAQGLPRLLESQLDLPAIVVSPQCPREYSWNDVLESLDALFDEITASYAVDLDRMYLTGLSMGGYGTWHYAARHPERFAAVVPICGGGAPNAGFPQKACVLKDVPLWVFHGARDEIVKPSESQKLVDVLQACGGNVRFTLYPEVGHSSWDLAYAEPELFPWLFAQARG